jgi:hypothetical protein
MQTYALQFDGSILRRGFWLYVWRISLKDGTVVHYVGRTGDSSSLKAQSPFNRITQHLSLNKNHNTLRKHLQAHGVEADACAFQFVAHGPVMAEGQTRAEHDVRRDRIAAIEKALADAMGRAGYKVLNTVSSKKQLDRELLGQVLDAFRAEVPRLGSV